MDCGGYAGPAVKIVGALGPNQTYTAEEHGGDKSVSGRPGAKLPEISPMTLVFFRRLVRHYFRGHFHGVRISGAERLSEASGPVIVYANHSSWWDPMVSFLLAGELLPGRRHFAPMEAAALDRYPIFKRLGVFGIDSQSARGAVQFLRTGEAILGSGGVLWVTPQGRFADARERPLLFKPGLAALASRVQGCTVLPLAIEYTFWDERKPEVLLLLGDAVRMALEPRANLDASLADALTELMDRLKTKALRRDPAAFERTLARGSVGTGGVYALWQRLRAALRGQAYRAEHTLADEPGGDEPLRMRRG